jgi:hypothetical protein
MEALRQVLGPMEAAVGKEAHEVEEAVVAGGHPGRSRAY